MDTFSLSATELLENINFFAPSFPKEKIFQQVQVVIETISQMYDEPLSQDLVIRIFMHAATMFERLRIGPPIDMPGNGYDIINRHIGMFTQLKEKLESICATLNLTIYDAEIYYFMLLLPNPKTMEYEW